MDSVIDIGIGALLFAAGIGIVWISKRLTLDLGEASKTAIILLPLLIFLIVANKLTEFEGYGLKAKFREISTEKTIDAARAADLAISNPEANKPNFYQEAFWLACRPYYVLTDNTAKREDDKDKLNQQATIEIAIAIRSALVCGRFVGLVVVDDSGRPVGLFRPEQFLEILRIPLVTYGRSIAKAVDLFDQINATELGVVLTNPVIRARSEEAEHLIISSDANLETAYKALMEEGAKVAMITDRHGRFGGIITRSAIEGRIIQKLLSSAK
jgi:hypothetical protein